MSDVYFILVEGLEDWPHPVPVAKCSGDENTACMLAEGLRSEFREEAPSLRFSYVRPTTPEDLLSLVSRLVGAHDEGEFGEQVKAVCRAAVRQWTFLEKWSKSKGNGGGVEATGEHAEAAESKASAVLTVVKWGNLAIGIDEDGRYLAVTPAPECGAVFPKEKSETLDLRGNRWKELLNLLARSEHGNTCETEVFMTAVGQIKRGDLPTAELQELAHQPDFQGFLAKRRKWLTDAIADLGRELREQVKGPTPRQGEPVLSAGDEGVIRARFVTRHLVRGKDEKLHFGEARS